MKNKVMEIRTRRGMTISELARRAKTSRQTIYSLEKQTIKNVSGPLMFRIADALEYDERGIFFDEGVTHEEQNLVYTTAGGNMHDK